MLGIVHLSLGKRIDHMVYYQMVKGELHDGPSIYMQMDLDFMIDTLKGQSTVRRLMPPSVQKLVRLKLKGSRTLKGIHLESVVLKELYLVFPECRKP